MRPSASPNYNTARPHVLVERLGPHVEGGPGGGWFPVALARAGVGPSPSPPTER
jgi:hypothetical protein